MKNPLSGFKEFAFKGNLIDMAVGLIIGGAFSTVVKSLVDNIFMPPLGVLIAGIDFKSMHFRLREAIPEHIVDGNVVKATPAADITYGQFITDFLSFILVALAVFMLVKKVLDIMKKDKAAPEPKVLEPSAEEKLLAEIRDLLKQKA